MVVKPFVVYHSRTGNTKKIANEIASVLGTAAANVKGIGKLPEDAFLIAGSGVYGGKMGGAMSDFLHALPPMKGRHAAVFETSGDDSKGVAIAKMRNVLERKGAKIVGSYKCKGSCMFFFNRGHPGGEDLEDARKFAEGLKKFLK